MSADEQQAHGLAAGAGPFTVGLRGRGLLPLTFWLAPSPTQRRLDGISPGFIQVVHPCHTGPYRAIQGHTEVEGL